MITNYWKLEDCVTSVSIAKTELSLGGTVSLVFAKLLGCLGHDCTEIEFICIQEAYIYIYIYIQEALSFDLPRRLCFCIYMIQWRISNDLILDRRSSFDE